MPTSLKIRQGLGPLGDVLIPVLAASGGTCYYDQGTVMVTTVGTGGAGGIVSVTTIVRVSSCLWLHLAAANIFYLNTSWKEITFYWHCALFLISQYGEDERSPGLGKCSVRILWHLLTFIPRARSLPSVVIRQWPSDGFIESSTDSVVRCLDDNSLLISLWWRAIILFRCVDLVPMWTIIWHIMGH